MKSLVCSCPDEVVMAGQPHVAGCAGFRTQHLVPISAVELTVDLSVTAQEMSSWSPVRIDAYFGGIAMAMSAKNGRPK